MQGLGHFKPLPSIAPEVEDGDECADGAAELAEGGDASAGPALGVPAAHEVPHAGVAPVPAEEDFGVVCGLKRQRAVPQIPGVREAQGRHPLDRVDRLEQRRGLQHLQLQLLPDPPLRLLVGDAVALKLEAVRAGH